MASFHALLPLSRSTGLESLPPVAGLLQSHQIGVPHVCPTDASPRLPGLCDVGSQGPPGHL